MASNTHKSLFALSFMGRFSIIRFGSFQPVGREGLRLMPRKKRAKSPYFLLAIDFGYTLLAAIGIFGAAGWWVDGKLQTKPWFLLLGIGLGIAVSFQSLMRRMRYLEQSQRTDSGPDDDAGGT